MSKNHSGEYYVRLAEKNDLRVEMGKGDHCKIFGEADRGYMVIPLHKELSKGVECSIRKWFKALGIVTTLLFVLNCIF